MSDLERLSERLADDERWRRDLTDEAAGPLLDAALRLLETAIAQYSPDDPEAEPYQAPYRAAAAGLIRDVLPLAARAVTAPDEAGAILRHGLAPLYHALALPGADAFQSRLDALLALDRPLTGTDLGWAIAGEADGEG